MVFSRILKLEVTASICVPLLQESAQLQMPSADIHPEPLANAGLFEAMDAGSSETCRCMSYHT
jgi:hypothetical protein